VKVLTLAQPWAYAITHLGKRIENRVWQTYYHGELAIHAGLSKGSPWRDDYLEMAARFPDLPTFDSLPRGVIVATCRLIFVRPADPPHQDRSRWECGPYCWELCGVDVLVEPIPWVGQQGLRDLPEDVIRRIEQAEKTRAPEPEGVACG
jgi:hypothetical protein